MSTGEAVKLTKKDFTSDQEVRWCPGCGDYAILSAVQKTMPDLGIKRENFVFVSGIGCSSRFPYYMDTYGIHSIHGRAPPVATGVKLANPDLSVWVITGDGDGLSIGGNHLMHAIRRNIDLNILLFNNRIYGLTKGQYSPTSELGKTTKSSPWGNIDHPINPLAVALGSNATFIARTIDRDPKHMQMIFKAAHAHTGVSFVEIIQNCNIFNDGAFEDFTDRAVKKDRQLLLASGEPLIFGAEGNKGISIGKDGLPQVVTIGENGITEEDIIVHDETRSNTSYAMMLANMDVPDFPVPVGVIRSIECPSYDHLMHDQVRRAKDEAGPGDLERLVRGNDAWTVQ